MNIISISVILIISAALLAATSFIFIKIYGRGAFCGLKLSGAVVIDNEDDAEAILYKITDNLCSDCECSSVKIVIIDGGMDINQYKICEKYCDKYSFFIISTPENVCDLIIDLQKKQ